MSAHVVAKGCWARIYRLELTPPERAPGIPEDTAAVPFETWINGWLMEDAVIGYPARLRTMTGRVVEGELVEVNPGYRHSFGSPPAALQHAGERALEQLRGGVRS